MLKTYILLGIAIVAEVIATTALAKAENFTRLGPSTIAIVFYALAFYLLSYPMRTMPAGVVYAIWSGCGIVLIAAVARFWYNQVLDLPAIIGLGFIITGVVIVNIFSKTVGH